MFSKVDSLTSFPSSLKCYSTLCPSVQPVWPSFLSFSWSKVLRFSFPVSKKPSARALCVRLFGFSCFRKTLLSSTCGQVSTLSPSRRAGTILGDPGVGSGAREIRWTGPSPGPVSEGSRMDRSGACTHSAQQIHPIALFPGLCRREWWTRRSAGSRCLAILTSQRKKRASLPSLQKWRWQTDVRVRATNVFFVLLSFQLSLFSWVMEF